MGTLTQASPTCWTRFSWRQMIMVNFISENSFSTFKLKQYFSIEFFFYFKANYYMICLFSMKTLSSMFGVLRMQYDFNSSIK